MSADPEPVTEAIDPVGHIVRTPGVMSGRPRIAGTRIRVSDVVVQLHVNEYTADEVADEVYPWISRADVYAALAYYYDHQDEIEREFDEDEAFAEQFAKDHPDIVTRRGG
jgi:uncharacterized protein (DUF433 family)